MARPSSVQQSGASSAGKTGTPAWPARRHYLMLAVLFAAVAVYGSLVPFQYRSLELGEALERFRQVPDRSLLAGSRADLVANTLLFVPIGYCWLAVFLVDRRTLRRTVFAVPLVVLLSGVLSVVIEFSQLWFPPRVVSHNDIFAQAMGTIVGTGLWLMTGQAIADWIRSLAFSTGPRRYVDWALQAYFVVLVIYSLEPLDLTISATDLVHKFREGRIALVPFSNLDSGLVWFGALLRQVVIFIPVGMLAATWLTPAERPVRRIGTSLVLGGLAVLGIESGQVFVESRPAATGDVITGMLGVLAGAWLMGRWRGRPEQDQPGPASSGSARRAGRWLALAGAYSLLMAIVLSTPAELVDDLQQLKARYEGFLCVPFARLEGSSELDITLELPKKLLLSAPLGALLSLAVVPLSVPPAIRRILLALGLVVVAGIGTAIEMAQVFLVPHVPDISDVILYTAGAAIGMLITLRVAGAGQAASSFTRI